MLLALHNKTRKGSLLLWSRAGGAPDPGWRAGPDLHALVVEGDGAVRQRILVVVVVEAAHLLSEPHAETGRYRPHATLPFHGRQRRSEGAAK